MAKMHTRRKRKLGLKTHRCHKKRPVKTAVKKIVEPAKTGPANVELAKE